MTNTSRGHDASPNSQGSIAFVEGTFAGALMGWNVDSAIGAGLVKCQSSFRIVGKPDDWKLASARSRTAASHCGPSGRTVVKKSRNPVLTSGSRALPATSREGRLARDLIAAASLVELNDISGLAHLEPGAGFVAGPLLNIYNEAAARELMRRGCVRLCANVELPLTSIAAIAAACPGLEIEIFAYGRLPLALSGRCYHARAHGLHKDACQFVCEGDPDGMAIHNRPRYRALRIFAATCAVDSTRGRSHWRW